MIANRFLKITRVWRDIPCSWIRRLNIVDVPVLLNLIYRVSVIPASYFVDTDKLILKFHGEVKSQNCQHSIEGEKQSWKTGTVDSKTYYKATLTKTV